MFRDSQTAPKECVGHLLSSLKEIYEISISLISHRNVSSKKPTHHHDLWDKIEFVSNTPIIAERQINEYEFDVVLFHNPRTQRQPALLNAKTILILHGDLSWELPELLPQNRSRIWLWHMAQRLFMPQLDHVFTVSKDLGNRMATRFDIPDECWSVLYNGVNTDQYHPEATLDLEKYGVEQPYLLHVSSYAKKKNPEGLLRAIGELSRDDPPLVICGSGWERQSVNEVIESLGIEDRIIRLGYVPEKDLPGMYANADVFVFPSLHETFGIPIVESLASGTPVITANVYSMPEIADGGGLFVDPESYTDISSGIKFLINNTDEKLRLGRNGINIAKRYSWKKSAEQMATILNTCSIGSLNRS